MKHLQTVILVLLTIGSMSKAMVWTYEHFHPAERVRPATASVSAR